MEFRILGPLEVVDDRRALRLGGGKQLALVAALLLNANEPVSVDRLVDELWGDRPPATAAKIVRNYVSLLRRELGDRLVTRAPGYLLRVEPGELDSERLERAVASGDRDQLGEALALWRGTPLSQLADEPFARIEIARLEELRLAATEAMHDSELAQGRHAAAVADLEALVRQHPLRERFRAQLMLALYRSGRQAEALEAYHDARRTLDEELGIGPGPALRELERKILNQDESLGAPTAVVAGPAREERPRPEPPTAREERKVVSVLYAHVGGAPGNADPEDAEAVRGPHRARIKGEVERFGGTVEAFLGNALVAVFGAPVAHEDDAERAVRAALAIRDWAANEDGVDVRIAVEAGETLVSLGSPTDTREGTVASDLVDTAARLHAAAPANGILVGETAYRATRDAIAYRDAEEMPKPSPAWEPLEARAPAGGDVTRGTTSPFVGRALELQLLVSALARVRDERSPQLVTLVGVPGIGKSRLALELRRAVDAEGEPITWRQGRSLSYGDGVSFWALGEAVKAQAGILESDSREQAEEKLHGTVADLLTDANEARWVEQQLRPLVGAAGELVGGERSGETFAAWRRFFEALADLSPLVLLLEDLHWADEGLLDFVDELADRIRDAPLLVLCTARSELLERRPAWGGGKPNAITLSIPPLSDDDTRRVVASTLKQQPAEVGNALLARAAGNPFYAEQFARMLAEVGTLGEVPESVQGIIVARLDGLELQEKALLHDAAVIGKVFWLGALEAMGAWLRGEAEELLVGLERKEFVQRSRRSSVAGVSEYAFRHVLLRDVAYGQIPRASRGEKHRRAAEWIESLGRPDDHAEMLAHHYLSALEYAGAAAHVVPGAEQITRRRDEDPRLAERARVALRAAGDRALGLASYPAAARFYRAALDQWPQNDPGRVSLVVDAGRAMYGADESGIDLLEQGFAELRARGNADAAAEVAVELARAYWAAGDHDAAYSYVDRALELAAGRIGSKARAHALVARAGYHLTATENAQAIRLAREALPLTEALRRNDLRARTLDVLGHARVLEGDAGGLDDSRRAIALARENNAFTQLVIAEFNLYISQFFLARRDAAADVLRAYRVDAESYGSSYLRRIWLGVEASAAVLDGRWSEATRVLDDMIAEADAGAAPHYGEPALRGLSASIDVARGDLESAFAKSRKALDRARTTQDVQLLAPALVLHGTVLVALGRAADASDLATEVLELGSTLVPALLSWITTATPIDFAWLLRDLNREEELLSALESAPSTPWVEAARAIARGDLDAALELIAGIGAPSVEAYAHLRTAEGPGRRGQDQEADHLARALAFFEQVGASSYAARAKQLLATSG